MRDRNTRIVTNERPGYRGLAGPSECISVTVCSLSLSLSLASAHTPDDEKVSANLRLRPHSHSSRAQLQQSHNNNIVQSRRGNTNHSSEDSGDNSKVTQG